MPLVVADTNGDDQTWTKGSSDVNGHAQAPDEDGFQHLPKLQQDILLLHGPRQKYSLEINGQIPELRLDREILIQVFGPSTDYRDVRKAAYQEYLVTTDFNVARLPAKISVNTGAALGVAFVSAVIALGVSLGFNFSNSRNAIPGPDLLKILRGTPHDNIPEDVREECLNSIEDGSRPRSGDFFAIWGGK
ncbi:MAG: hypothetical protein Q9167_003310 [Letrouitia subvulpina]